MRPIDRRAAVLGLLGTVLTPAARAYADTWPSRPVTMVVPFTAGGTSDVVARGLARELGEKLGQPFRQKNGWRSVQHRRGHRRARCGPITHHPCLWTPRRPRPIS